jgi:hypothetical protein
MPVNLSREEISLLWFALRYYASSGHVESWSSDGKKLHKNIIEKFEQALKWM